MSSQCNVPVHPSDHYLLGTKWHNQYYVDLALPFDLHSAPCFLNLIPDTVEWIRVHSYHIPALLYYLDNLITNALPPTPPQDSKPCLHNLSTVLAVCKQLGLPLHLGKYQGPATVLAVLGFELDSVNQAACLPADKLLASQGLISLCLPQSCSTFNRGQ